MRIRKATKKDLGAISKLFLEYENYEHNLDKSLEVSSLKKEKEQNKKYMDLGTSYFVIEDKGEILGALDINIDKRGKENVGVLHTLIVTSKARGKGYGDKLIKHALNYFKSKGCKRARTFVHFKNKNGYSFWKKYGFNFELGYNATKKL
jgi:N-acetylglutamate synthase-like GNAT family acetyltransferase